MEIFTFDLYKVLVQRDDHDDAAMQVEKMTMNKCSNLLL